MHDQLSMASTAITEIVKADAAVHAHMAQAIQCGPWSLALSFDWANTIIDQFELVTIPKAPEWLIGAVNLDGGIVPVVDLAAYFEPDGRATAIDRHHRLLVGGRTHDSNEHAVAILFSGLPFQIQYTREPVSTDFAMPERLREICRGVARSDQGQSHLEIDTHRFIDNLSMSLMDI
jgi:chemotaxis signal transduction protein